MPGCGCGDYLDSNIFTPSAPELLAAMHCHQNLVGRQWTVKVRLSDGPDAASPRNLAGYRALCLTKKPPNIDCFVEIARPKDLY